VLNTNEIGDVVGILTCLIVLEEKTEGSRETETCLSNAVAMDCEAANVENLR
jgi:hypothetical protein